jgi:hypothetical protein
MINMAPDMDDKNSSPKRIFLFSLILTILMGECSLATTLGIASGQATADGRPLLWINLDGDDSQVSVAYFNGTRFHFLGIIPLDDTTTVWVGVNNAGLALASSVSVGLEGDSTGQSGQFLKTALALCADVQEFQNLLNITNDRKRKVKAHFACFDKRGRAALFEVGNSTYTFFDVDDPVENNDHFLIRSNFSIAGTGNREDGVWRYHRAKKLFQRAIKSRILDYKYVLQYVARDLASEEIDPDPWLRGENPIPQAAEFLDTQNSLDSYNTAACCVFQGVRENEDELLTTLWIILGNPVAGVAVPLLCRTGAVPKQLVSTEAGIIKLAGENKDKLYKKVGSAHYLNLKTYTGKKVWSRNALLKMENDVFDIVDQKMLLWRRAAPSLKELAAMQQKAIDRILAVPGRPE